MPRLLSVNSYHYRRGGSDVVYFDHAALLEAAGWENAFFSMRHPKNIETPWSRYFVDEIEFGHEYTLSQKLKMAGKVIYSLEAQRKLRQLLQEYPAQLAHLHCIYHHLSPSILSVFQEAQIPVVLTAHDLKIACPAYKMLNSGGICERCKDGSYLNVVRHRCVRGSLAASAVVAVESSVHRWLGSYRKQVAKIVAPSRFFVRKFVEWGWPEGSFEYIPNYVDASQFEPDFQAGRYFLYFGRMISDKGVATLIRAAHAAAVPLKLVGTGPDEVAFQALAAELGADVEFLGYRSGADLHRWIRSARAVVLPSEIYENAPMSVLESFALGKPAIGADIGGIPEMIEPGSNGWVFPSGDVQALAERLSQVQSVSNAGLEVMGRAARAHVVENFNRQAYVDRMLSLYASLGVSA